MHFWLEHATLATLVLSQMPPLTQKVFCSPAGAVFAFSHLIFGYGRIFLNICCVINVVLKLKKVVGESFDAPLWEWIYYQTHRVSEESNAIISNQTTRVSSWLTLLEFQFTLYRSTLLQWPDTDWQCVLDLIRVTLKFNVEQRSLGPTNTLWCWKLNLLLFFLRKKKNKDAVQREKTKNSIPYQIV